MFAVTNVVACTTFQLKSDGEVYFGRNYDWGFSDALIVVNQAGVKKPGFPHRREEGERASWTSRYGSVTFNQYGRELASGGMNSEGLVVEAMTLLVLCDHLLRQRAQCGAAGS